MKGKEITITQIQREHSVGYYTAKRMLDEACERGEVLRGPHGIYILAEKTETNKEGENKK